MSKSEKYRQTVQITSHHLHPAPLSIAPRVFLNNTHHKQYSVSSDPLEIRHELTLDYSLDNPVNLSLCLAFKWRFRSLDITITIQALNELVPFDETT